jgi:two-component system sensor histidine kinase PilS (NtrC family)
MTLRRWGWALLTAAGLLAGCGTLTPPAETIVDAASGRPWLDVRDRGAGIGAVEQQRLFEPFFTTSHTGTGLGLYISRELCAMNRATLEYRPPTQGGPATGACFRIGFAHPDRMLDQRPRTTET